ncbi:MAG: PQQ-dependent sugar dehydrogenase [Deltaproteobacteria bacterium]|nr:PQQ-dependent sugar dehydrogenase [Deltaproteobacteria bacterium]
MRSLATISLLAVVGCGSDGPTPSEFGLDTRPSNTTCLARARPTLDTGVVVARQWQNITFNQPLGLVQAPGDNTRWYVVERNGQIRTFLDSATSNAQVQMFGSVAVNASGEGGLLGFAFHPAWPNKLEAYLSYTRNPIGGDPAPPSCAGSGFPFSSVVARFRSTTGAALDGGSEEILRVGQPYSNHDGGNIGFGRDGYLYFGLGDGGSGDDPCSAGQDMGSLLGKMLRVDVDVANGYKVPADNPFFGMAGVAPEIWASGLRNPWRWSFDRDTGELWVGDVGQGTWEEIDRVVKGGNYGWKTCEGFHRRGSTTAMCNTPGMADPVVVHGRGDAQSITGGYVYRGTAMPSLVGTYIYGDFATGNIWALLFDAENRATPTLLGNVGGNTLASFGQGHDGEIYTVQINGTISKLVPAAPQPPDTFPRKLSETGCFAAADPRKPVEALIPYDVNAPLWSDGADKERFLAIPDGTTIAIGDDGDWDLPIGSVVAKTFAVGGARVETRLFMRHDDGGWGGYTYEWDDDGKDATLLPAGKLRELAAQAWIYPSRNQCIQCHSKAAGGTIGLETAQLNRDGVYPSTNRIANQLATLDHIGMFAAPLAAKPDTLAKFPDPVAGTDPLEARARAYLHANCSHCHRPQGGGQGTMDLRFATTFADTDTCNATNTQGPINGATVLVAPGAPGDSVLSRRLHATDAKRMPPVSVSVVDTDGARVIDDWITSLTTCP